MNNNEDIVGSISLEQFDENGLIRYFIFYKDIEKEAIEELFYSLIDTAKECNINKIYSIVLNEESYNLFNEFKFEKISSKDFYVNEDNIFSKSNKNAVIMKRNI